MADSIQVDLAELGRLAKAAGADFGSLAATVRQFGRSSYLPTMNADLKQARRLLKESAGNIDIVRTALKGAGVSTRDTTMLIQQLNRELNKGRQLAMGFGGAWKQAVYQAFGPTAGKAVDGVVGKLKSFGGGIVGAALHKTVELGEGLLHKVIELGGEAEASQKGLSYILSGGAEEGSAMHAKGEAISKNMMAEFLALAKKTPIADRDIVSAGKDFATALSGSGRSMEEVQRISLQLVKVMADQQSKFLEDSAVRRNFVNSVTRGLGKTTASLQDLNSLRVAKFNIGAILEKLPEQKGMAEIMAKVKKGKFKVTAEDLAAARENVGEGEISGKELENMAKMQKLISMAKQAGTPIAYSTLFNAAQASIYKGKDVGEAAGGLAAYKSASTLIGAVNNASNAFDNLLLGMDIAGSKGGKALRDFLNQFNEVIGHSTVLQDSIRGLINAVFEPLSKITKEDIEGIIRKIGKLGEIVIDVIKQAWGWFDKLIHAEPGAFLASIKSVLVDVGTYLGQGILKGVVGGGVTAVAESTGTSRYSSIAQGSSARAWRNLWEDTGGRVSGAIADFISPNGTVGDDIPKMAKGGIVDRPTLALIGEGGEREYVIPESKMGGMRGGGAQLIVQGPLFTVQGDVKDPDALGVAIRPIVAEEFANVWHRFAAEAS